MTSTTDQKDQIFLEGVNSDPYHIPAHQENRSELPFVRFHELAKTREEIFEKKFSQLEDYLTKVLEQHNYKFSSGSQEEEKISMAKAKAKEYFKNFACEVFRSIKSKFQEQQFHHIIPDDYLDQTLDKLKLDMSASLDQLTERIVEVLFPIIFNLYV
jgi:hypothetical protein